MKNGMIKLWLSVKATVRIFITDPAKALFTKVKENPKGAAKAAAAAVVVAGVSVAAFKYAKNPANSKSAKLRRNVLRKGVGIRSSVRNTDYENRESVRDAEFEAKNAAAYAAHQKARAEDAAKVNAEYLKEQTAYNDDLNDLELQFA